MLPFQHNIAQPSDFKRLISVITA
jgi:hypothetical protein